MTMKNVIAMVVALVAWTAVAVSQETKQVFNNMAMELAECAAYFGVVSIAMENSNKPEQAKAWEEQRDKALEFAAIVSKEAGLKEETVGARFSMAVEDMSKRIDKNTSNISILMADYNEPCIKAMTDPKERARYWFERLAAPHQ
jgi:hypothetical protein